MENKEVDGNETAEVENEENERGRKRRRVSCIKKKVLFMKSHGARGNDKRT